MSTAGQSCMYLESSQSCMYCLQQCNQMYCHMLLRTDSLRSYTQTNLACIHMHCYSFRMHLLCRTLRLNKMLLFDCNMCCCLYLAIHMLLHLCKQSYHHIYCLYNRSCMRRYCLYYHRRTVLFLLLFRCHKHMVYIHIRMCLCCMSLLYFDCCLFILH